MDRPIDGMQITMLTDRVISLLDTLLLCLGLTMTVAAVGPLLESAFVKVRRAPVRLLRSGGN